MFARRGSEAGPGARGPVALPCLSKPPASLAGNQRSRDANPAGNAVSLVSAEFTVSNETRGVVIGCSIRRADTSRDRRTGLLGCQTLSPGQGLWIIPCEGVHTFGMRFAIDVIYLDRDYKIRKLIQNLPPWRASVCLTAHSVLELPAGVILETGCQIGDRLCFTRRADV